MHFGERLTRCVRELGTPTCVGLDPHLSRLPESIPRDAAGVERFFRGVIDAIAGKVPAVKPQAAFFEQLGAPGVAALENVCHAARDAGLLVILDVKRGDIGSTAEAYAHAALDDDGPIGADALTLSPYLGPESLAPFTKRVEDGKGMFVLVRTSNPGSGAWQVSGEGAIAPRVAQWISEANGSGEGYGPIGAVIGATVPDEAGTWRNRMPRAWFLVPGFGAQGATAADIQRHAGADHLGALVTSSRAVLFPSSGTDGPDWPEQVARRCDRLVADVSEVLQIARL